MTRLAGALVLLALAAAPKGTPPADAPDFLPELAPLVGTWKRIKAEKKEPDSFLVIKEEGGKLRLRYQLPRRSKVYTSDWSGSLVVKLQVHVEEHHDARLAAGTDPPRIDVSQRIHYAGTWEAPETSVEASYDLDPEGRLRFRVRSIRQGDKELPLPAPLLYERVSERTEWPRR